MFIQRILAPKIKDVLGSGESKVVIIYGPRQAGKTTLIKELQKNLPGESLYFTGDDLFTQKTFGTPELAALKKIVGDSRWLIIDEAQRIDNIGLTLKLLVDNLPLTIIASGSASFDLADKISEPLTGRTTTFWLYPLAYTEVKDQYRATLPLTALEGLLRFGMYPKVLTMAGETEKQEYLLEYLNHYLYKDILTFAAVRKPKKIIDLLTLLALQVGQLVSIHELAGQLSMSQATVAAYLEVLEKMFVLVNVRGFSRNLRKEISKTSKYYFLDVGVRNALLRNFNSLALRQDVGALFENWFIVERLKRAQNSRESTNFYFWRTYDGQEVDLVEERAGQLVGWECKWILPKKTAAPKDWLTTYPNANYQIVSSETHGSCLV